MYVCAFVAVPHQRGTARPPRTSRATVPLQEARYGSALQSGSASGSALQSAAPPAACPALASYSTATYSTLLTARRSTRKRTASAWKTGKTAGSDQTGIRPLSASASKSGRVIAVEMIVVELREPSVRAPAELVLQPAHDQRRPPRPRGGRHVSPARGFGCSALAFSDCVRKKKSS